MQRQYIAWAIAILSLLAAISLVLSPTLNSWGLRHTADSSPTSLTLGYGHTIGQSFQPEFARLNTIVVWLKSDSILSQSGSLLLELKSENKTYQADTNFADIPPSGRAIFQFSQPIKMNPNSTAQFFLTPQTPGQKIELLYQIDGTKFTQGELIHFNEKLKKSGDLAFQIRYSRPALGNQTIQWGYALAIAIAGTITAISHKYFVNNNIFRNMFRDHSRRRESYLIENKKSMSSASRNMVPEDKQDRNRNDAWLGAILVGVMVTLFYLVFFWQPGFWVGTADFTKDTSYVQSSSQAIKSGSWPVWSHLTCGGMAAIGNPEGNTISLGTILGLTMPAEKALWLLLALEAGIGAAGAYLLARALKLTSLASITATAIYILSGTYAYRLAEGFTMLGGPTAFVPWVFLGLVQRKPFLAGLALAAMFLRGDVHVVIGIIIIVTIWLVFQSLRDRSWKPLAALATIAAISLLIGSIKILPYLEQPQLIGGALHPYVVPIIQSQQFNSVFLTITDRSLRIPTLHSQRPIHFGNFGSYIGIVPFVLAAIGIFSKNRYRTLLVISAAAAFLLSEGWLFDTVLRHLGPLDVLLRIPTRLLTIFVLFLGLLAGLGLDKISRTNFAALARGAGLFNVSPAKQGKLRRKNRQQNFVRLITVLITTFIIIDLTLATSTILSNNLWQRTATTLSLPQQPTLSPHTNFSPQDKSHSSTLLRSGYLLPQICGDQNNPPEFLSKIKQPTPISTSSTSLNPNSITLALSPNQIEYGIKSRFTSSALVDQGILVPAEDGSIDLIVPNNVVTQSATITYSSSTKRVQQILVVLLTLMIVYTVKHAKVVKKQ